METLIKAIQDGDIETANVIFRHQMSEKVASKLEAEKVRVASGMCESTIDEATVSKDDEKKYDEMYQKFKDNKISKDEWTKFCTGLLTKILK